MIRASDAIDRYHSSGGNLVSTAHSYLDALNSSWFGGGKWNPILQTANLVTGYSALESGEIKAGDKYKGMTPEQMEAQARANRQHHADALHHLVSGKHTDAEIAQWQAEARNIVNEHGFGALAQAHRDPNDDIKRLLTKIADNTTKTAPPANAGHAAPNRTTSMSNRPTGAQ